MSTRKKDFLRVCDFCNKTQKEAIKIIEESDKDLHICDECIDLCDEVIENETSFNLDWKEAPKKSKYHQPAEMTAEDVFVWGMS
ncbi:ClpX C4-type zinc finger protein [Microbispora rosea]